jgi:hypothetical protein
MVRKLTINYDVWRASTHAPSGHDSGSEDNCPGREKRRHDL